MMLKSLPVYRTYEELFNYEVDNKNISEEIKFLIDTKKFIQDS